MTNTAKPKHPSAGTVRRHGVVVYLGSKTGLVRSHETGKQILFRRDESDGIYSDGERVEFTLDIDPRNGQRIAVNVQSIR